MIAPRTRSHTVANPHKEKHAHSVRDDKKSEGNPITRLRHCREI